MEKIRVASISLEYERVHPTELTLSNGHFQDMIELCERDESWLSRDIFPPDKTLALLAHLTYKNDLHETMFSSDFELQLLAFSTYKKKLLTKLSSSNKTLDQTEVDNYGKNLNESLIKIKDDWRLLTTARNESDGYFGAAFWNSKEQQLVISHRGTNPKDADALLADVEGIIRNRHTSQINSAFTFVDHVLNELSIKKRFKQIQISITGHSLGAWLAQVTTFSSEYLTIDREKDKFRVKSEEDAAHHVHCVGFESPGCGRMLTKLFEKYHRRYERPDHIFWTNLDITLYLTRPNMVNTCCKHVGKLFQIDIPPFIKSNSMFLKVACYVLYVLHYHSMENIIMAISNNNIIQVIHDWPCVTFPERTKNDESEPSKSSILKLIKGLPNLVYDCVAKSGQEVDEFWNYANNENSYSPKPDKNIEWGIRLHYKVRDLLTSVCHLNTFSKVEQLFLFCWPNETTLRINLKNEIKKELPNFKLDAQKFLFETFFYIENDKHIKCPNFNVNDLVNFTKQLFRFIKEPKHFVQTLSHITQTNVLICKTFSDSYIQQVIIKHLEFRDTIDLEAFLNSKEFKKTLLIKTGFKFEIQRIYSILRESKINFIFLDLTQLIHLNNYLYLSETINSITDHVIVVDCQQEQLIEKDLILLGILLRNTKTLQTIVVVQSDLAEKTIRKVCKNDVECVERNANLCFSDLTHEANFWLKNVFKNKVKLQGKKVDLLKFMGGVEVLDSNFVAEWIKDNKIIEIGSEPMKLCQTEAAYAKRLKFIKAENLVYALKNDSKEIKEELFIITSANEISVEHFIQLLQIGDKNDEQKIMDFTRIFEIEYENIEYNKCNKINLLKSGRETHFKFFCYCNSDKIVYWLEIINQQFYLHQIFDTDFYVKRHVHHHKCIKDNAIAELCYRERFVISGTNSYGTSKRKINQDVFYSTNENETLHKYKEWSEDSSCIPVHWLKVENEQLVWQQSNFYLKTLRSYLDLDNQRAIDEEALANLNSRVVVIVAEPGMGKSTTLTRLSEFMLGNSWVIRLNLKDHQDEALKLPADYYNTNKAVDSIVAFLMNVSHMHSTLTDILLKHSLINKISRPLLILFDGYDEIEKEFQAKLILLMKYLKEKTFANIWITSRKHFTKDLEDELCVFSTTFKELTLDERQAFLRNFWQVRLKLELSEAEHKPAFSNKNKSELNKFEQFSVALLKKVDKVLDEKMSKFMGIPLQMRLLAENFLLEFEEFVKGLGGEVPQFDEINVTQIYQRYIKVKFNIYFQEKSKISIELNEVFTKWFANDLIKRHQYIAFQLLFPKEVKILLAIEPSLSENDLVIEPDEEIGLKRIGLIHSPQYSGQLEFIHRTFAEYFVANLILDWLKKPICSETFNAIESLIKLIFDKFEIICSFLNDQITAADVARVKHVCFNTNVFCFLEKLFKNNHSNLVAFISSFFTNKIWLLNQCQFNPFLNAILDPKWAELAKGFRSLIIHHYNVLHNILLQQSRKISQFFKLRTEEFNLYEMLEKEKCQWFKFLLNLTKYHIKIMEEFVKDYQLEDLVEMVKKDEELLRLINQIKKKEKVTFEDNINRLVNSIRDKYKGSQDGIHQLYKFFNDNKNQGTSLADSQTSIALIYFNNLVKEQKPRRIIKDFQYLYCTLNTINVLAIVIVKQLLNNNNFTKKMLRDKLMANEISMECDENLFLSLNSYCELIDIKEKLKNEKKIVQFLECLKSDKKLSELLSLLVLKKCTGIENQKVNKVKPQDGQGVCRRIALKVKLLKKFKKEKAFDDEKAVQMINASVEIPKIFLCFNYYNDHLKALLHKELSAEDQINFVYYGFQNESQPILSILPFAFSNLILSFLNQINCEDTKYFLSQYLPITAIVDFILENNKIATLINDVLKQLKERNITTVQAISKCVKQYSNVSCLVENATGSRTYLEIEILEYVLHMLFICDEKEFYDKFTKVSYEYLNKLLLYIENFPGICYLIILKIFKPDYIELMFAKFSQPNIYLFFVFACKNFPDIIPCMVITGGKTHMSYAVQHNNTNVVNLLFAVLKPCEKFLEHYILFPKNSPESCLHVALLKSKTKTLEHFLSELNKNVKIMKSVVEHFVDSEDDKLDLFQAAEKENPGVLLIFLNYIKVDELLERFLLPADRNVKPAFYLAGERGCKEVMDTLLSALKSESVILWALITWTEPNSGQTVLHKACEKGYKEIVEALLDSIRMPDTLKLNVLFSHKDNSGYTALDCAILSKRQIIKNKFDYNSQSEIYKNNNYKKLRENFSNYDFANKQPQCLQTLSSSLKYLPMIINLLLIIAKSFNNVELMLAIFENADLNPVLEEMYITLDTYSYHLFHCSIERGSLKLVKGLVEIGINVNATNGYGFTPLMRAVYKNNIVIVKLLLNSGADAFFRDMNGESACSIAADKNNSRMLDLFPYSKPQFY